MHIRIKIRQRRRSIREIVDLHAGDHAAQYRGIPLVRGIARGKKIKEAANAQGAVLGLQIRQIIFPLRARGVNHRAGHVGCADQKAEIYRRIARREIPHLLIQLLDRRTVEVHAFTHIDRGKGFALLCGVRNIVFKIKIDHHLRGGQHRGIKARIHRETLEGSAIVFALLAHSQRLGIRQIDRLGENGVGRVAAFGRSLAMFNGNEESLGQSRTRTVIKDVIDRKAQLFRASLRIDRLQPSRLHVHRRLEGFEAEERNRALFVFRKIALIQIYRHLHLLAASTDRRGKHGRFLFLRCPCAASAKQPDQKKQAYARRPSKGGYPF